MYQPVWVEQARILTDAHDPRERAPMNIPLLTLEVHANALEQERRMRQLKNEQLRVAQEQRRSPLSTVTRAVRNHVGKLLINVGESLRPQPATPSDCTDIPTTA